MEFFIRAEIKHAKAALKEARDDYREAQMEMLTLHKWCHGTFVFCERSRPSRKAI
jgi:predicted ATPase